MDAVKRTYIEEAERLGSVPASGLAKGELRSRAEQLTGRQAATLINKLGERLAFERTGTRVYDSFLIKCEVARDQGQTAVDLPIHRIRKFRDQELRHFLLLADTMESFGADSTVETPDADAAAMAGSGLMTVINDPRTSLPQCLEAMTVLELSDNAAWELLIKLARDLGQDEMAEKFQAALTEEQNHLREIRSWYEQSVLSQASGPGH